MNIEPRELVEYEPYTIRVEEFSEELALLLFSSYPTQIKIEGPSFQNKEGWKLTSQGWVGYIPLNEDFQFLLSPKIPIPNLFRMLEYAYKLTSFRFLEGFFDSDRIVDFYDRLAIHLSQLILNRIRQGLYRSYVSVSEGLPYVRGRIDVMAHLRATNQSILPCNYEDHTSDIEDNQILMWTLNRILECRLSSERSLPFVRQAYRVLQCYAYPTPFSPDECRNRLYNRLNQDYKPMHALCRFFLENTGPTINIGNRKMRPFLVDMDRLFELFVFEWLKQHLPENYTIRGQDHIIFKENPDLSIFIDISIEDTRTNTTTLIIDTKYKVPESAASADVQQVVAYAELKGCTRAMLVYPKNLKSPLSVLWGNKIHIESQAFNLDTENIDQSGQALLNHIFYRPI